MTNRTAHIPAGFELVNDTPLYRFRRVWPVGQKPKTQRSSSTSTRSKRSDRP